MVKKSFDKKGTDDKKVEEILQEEKKDNVKEAEGQENPAAEEAAKAAEKRAQEQKEEEEKKRAEEESLTTKLLRLQADFLNYKNRTEKEKTTTYGNAVSDVISCLLPVVDNLERALEADTSADNSFKDGVQMIYTQLMGILEKKGLKEIEALHKPFDHNIHYGVAFDDNSQEPDGTVIEVLQKGYTVNDRVIRPSMVRIAKK